MHVTAEILRSVPDDERDAFMSTLTDQEAAVLTYSWEFWARPNQIMPPSMSVTGNRSTWLILAGRGFGKTRVGSQTVISEIEAGNAGRVALIAETAADARDVMVEGDSGILACSPPWFRPTYEPSKRKLTWPNGAIAHTFNAVEPDQLRGPQFDFAWGDEIAKWRYAQASFDNLQFSLRLGRRPRAIFTTTPRPIPLIMSMVRDPSVEVTKGRTLDNSDNLASSFLTKVERMYAGTRLGRQELDAEILDDVPGALWTRDMIDACQVSIRQLPTDLLRIVVAVDPSGCAGPDDERSDEIGIVVAGISRAGIVYVLEDCSGRYSPEGWGREVVAAYKRHRADKIVAERNFGGAMVESTIRTVDPTASYKEVVASRGKVRRAEPVAALYEQSKVKHVGALIDIEDQLVMFSASGYVGPRSPDRADAAIWAITELAIEEQEPRPFKVSRSLLSRI
jgi:phage terminase large subunit-like protein